MTSTALFVIPIAQRPSSSGVERAYPILADLLQLNLSLDNYGIVRHKLRDTEPLAGDAFRPEFRGSGITAIKVKLERRDLFVRDDDKELHLVCLTKPGF